jgi:hypothetical protein
MTDSSSISSEVDFDYLANPTTKTEEEVWCKINPEGNLEHFDWNFVEKTAREFDAAGAVAPKNNAQIICKLAVLIRQQTLEQAAQLLLKYKDVSAASSVVVLKDLLEEEV